MARRTVRDATTDDAGPCAEIYAPYVTETAISFELEPPGPDVMADRIADAQNSHAWLVLEDAGRVIGYAYGGTYKSRAAYRWSCEVSVYVDRRLRGGGGGRVLYSALFERLARRGYRTAVAGMTLPNEASERLHRGFGFVPIGTYREIGWKLDAWHDVAWLQLRLGAEEGPPGPVR